jgi:hypothetical protein
MYSRCRGVAEVLGKPVWVRGRPSKRARQDEDDNDEDDDKDRRGPKCNNLKYHFNILIEQLNSSH